LAAAADPDPGFPRNPRRKNLLGPTSKKVPVAIAIVIILLRIIRGPKLPRPFRGAWYKNQKEDFSMNRAISLAILAGGILLTIYGAAASKSFSSDISRFFTGSPTDKAMWMLIGGVVAIIIGLVGLLRGSKGN
jgi:hypothetical protein